MDERKFQQPHLGGAVTAAVIDSCLNQAAHVCTNRLKAFECGSVQHGRDQRLEGETELAAAFGVLPPGVQAVSGAHRAATQRLQGVVRVPALC